MQSLIRLALDGSSKTRHALIGTDLNLKMQTIRTGLIMEKTWQDGKKRHPPQCVFASSKNGLQKHHGDLVIGLNLEMMQVDCCVKNRDPQHDCVVAGLGATLPTRWNCC